MIKQDTNVNWISTDMVSPEGSLPENRREKYLLVMKKIGIDSIHVMSITDKDGLPLVNSQKNTTGPISFGVFSNGGGILKGYTYSTESLTPLYGSLDKWPPGLKAYEFGYKQISTNWYLYYSSMG